MVSNSFYTYDELLSIGLRHIGNNVLISCNAHFYGAEVISIGSNVRIDDYCILSGKISIGNNVHISSSTLLYGGTAGIVIGDYCNISSRCGVYAITDDFSNSSYLGPMVNSDNRIIVAKKVVLSNYSAIGTGSTVLPGTFFEEGSVLGAMSFAKNQRLLSWSIYCGAPCYKLKNRKKEIREL